MKLKSIYDLKQFSTNVEYSEEVMNDFHKRAENAGYHLSVDRRITNYRFYRGGYWEVIQEKWCNEENCVTIHYCSWNWGKDHPDYYKFDGHIMSEDELWGRVPAYRPEN